MRILAADDTEPLRLLIERILGKAGHVVELVDDGDAACARYAPGRFDLVILDLQMPTVDGCAAAARIRATERAAGAARVPILALTASAVADEDRRCREAGCDGLLGKPFGKDELLAAVASLTSAAAPGPGSSPVPPIEAQISELVPAYLEQRRSDLAELSTALRAGDLPAVARLAHRMAGSGTSYGFAPITELSRALEAAAKRADALAALREFERLASFIERARPS